MHTHTHTHTHTPHAEYTCTMTSLISNICTFFLYPASLVAQTVKHLPAMWDTWVRSLGRVDPLEEEMATHSSTLAWKIPWTEEPGGLQSMRSQRVRHDWATSLSFFFIPYLIFFFSPFLYIQKHLLMIYYIEIISLVHFFYFQSLLACLFKMQFNVADIEHIAF